MIVSGRVFGPAVMMIAGLPLTGCQMSRDRSPWTREQIAMLNEAGFLKTGRGWEFSVDDRLLFPTDQSQVAADQAAIIGRIATRLLSVNIRHAAIEGHTDRTGTDRHNLALSKSRAETVARVLEVTGFPRANLSTVGLGERFPIDTNATAEGRRENRRVVILLSAP